MLIVRLNPVLTCCLAMDSFRRKFQDFQIHTSYELIQLRMVYVHALLP